MKIEKVSYFVKGLSVLVFVVILSACASTPTISVVLSSRYQGYLLPPTGLERKIDDVSVRSSSTFLCRDGQHAISPQQRLGAAYEVRDPNAPQPTGLAAVFSSSGSQRSADRHDHEPIFDQLLNEARRQYPSETVDIRNSRTSGHMPTNARLEEYTDKVLGNDGLYYDVKRTRTVWDCFLVYTADTITSEPKPEKITYSETFTMTGSTRNDNYRRAQNWLEDNEGGRRIRIDSRDFDGGRIRCTVTIVVRADHTYFVPTAFTVDVFDARLEIQFTASQLQRTNASQQNVGSLQDIFLQSIADAALAEMIAFSTTFRTYIITRQ